MPKRLKRHLILKSNNQSRIRVLDSLITELFFGQHFCTQGCQCGLQEASSRNSAIRKAFEEELKAYIEERLPEPSHASSKSELDKNEEQRLEPSKASCESEIVKIQDECDMSEFRTAFDLSDLDADYQIYDLHNNDFRFLYDKCIEWLKRIEIEDKDLSAKDPSFQLEKHLDSVTERLNFISHSVDAILGQVQLFNAEKRFEPPQMVYDDIYNQRGEHQDSEQTRLDLQSSFNDPTMLTRITSVGKDLKQKSEPSDPDESLASWSRNLLALVEEAKRIDKSLSSNDTVPTMASDLSSYHSIPVPESFPHATKQHLSDVEFLQSECAILPKDLIGLRDAVFMALQNWVDNGKGSWEWGKSHVHDLASFRKYEYHRIDLYETYVTLRMAEEVVVNYLNGRYLDEQGDLLDLRAEQVKKGNGPSCMSSKPCPRALSSAVLEGQETLPIFVSHTGTASRNRFADDIDKLNSQKTAANGEAFEKVFGMGGGQRLWTPVENLQLHNEKEPLSRKLSDMTDATASTHWLTDLTLSLKLSDPNQFPTSAKTLNSATRLPFQDPVVQAKTPASTQLDIQRQRLTNAVASPKWRNGLLTTLQVIELQYPDAEPQIQHALALCAEFRIGRMSKHKREREWDEKLSDLYREFPAVDDLIKQIEDQGNWHCEEWDPTDETCKTRGDASRKTEGTEKEDACEKEAEAVDEEPKENESHEKQGQSKKKRNNKNKNRNRKIKKQAEKKAAKEAHSQLEMAES
ncbi:MAG: hypothetical protein Q9167_007396 [Letrouitia subvulpina]